MRAVVFDQHSPKPDNYYVHDNLIIPEPDEDEVVVRVNYAALNRLDNFVRIGWRGLSLDFPHIPCADFSGRIHSVGKQVSGWEVGTAVTANPLVWSGDDRFTLRGEQNRSASAKILGEHLSGACAQYVRVPAVNLIAIPDAFDMKLAAAASLTYLTAWHSLVTIGKLQPGEHVLIVGAGGGVNVAATQIASLLGCQIIVIASNADKARQAQKNGAHQVVDRSEEPDWGRAVYLATRKQGLDMVVDNVGAATWASSLRCLRPGGRLVTVGGTSGYQAEVPVNLMFARHLQILGSTMGTHDDYQKVMQLVFDGKLVPVVDSIFKMKDFGDAMHKMLANSHFGKILIEIA